MHGAQEDDRGRPGDVRRHGQMGQSPQLPVIFLKLYIAQLTPFIGQGFRIPIFIWIVHSPANAFYWSGLSDPHFHLVVETSLTPKQFALPVVIHL
jgi:hypothetical protein